VDSTSIFIKFKELFYEDQTLSLSIVGHTGVSH